jgi:transcriptional regulator with XRE-family HTH domain
MKDIRLMTKPNSLTLISQSHFDLKVPTQVAMPTAAPVSCEILEPFLDKEYRDAYLENYVTGRIAHQIHALRTKSGLSQKQFGEEIGKPQSVVSRLENTEYGGVTINTLLSIAKARNVGLHVSFTDYVDVLSDDISAEGLKVDTIYDTYERCARPIV